MDRFLDWYLRNVFTCFAVFLWLVVALAGVDLWLGGNPTAINGVLGGTAAGILVTTVAVIWRRHIIR